MTAPRHGLGGRLPLLAPADLTPEQADFHRELVSDWVPWAQRNGFDAATGDGEVIGPFNALLLNPGVGAAFLALQTAESTRTSLSRTVREVVILSVGAVWQAPYELYAHSAVGSAVGLSADDVDALATGSTPRTLSDDELVAHRFARELTATHRVTDELYAEAQQTFGAAGVFDMVVLAGLYHTVCAMLNAFDVPRP